VIDCSRARSLRGNIGMLPTPFVQRLDELHRLFAVRGDLEFAVQTVQIQSRAHQKLARFAVFYQPDVKCPWVMDGGCCCHAAAPGDQ
jgi:hypothetical protein